MSSLWLARISNHSILKKISPEYSLEELMLKLKLQYFDLLMWTAHSLGKALMLGKFEGRSRGQQRMRWLDGITESIVMNLSKLWEIAKASEACYAAIHGSQRVKHNLSTEQWVGRLFQLFQGEGGELQDWAITHFWPFIVGLRTIMALVDVSLRIC